MAESVVWVYQRAVHSTTEPRIGSDRVVAKTLRCAERNVSLVNAVARFRTFELNLTSRSDRLQVLESGVGFQGNVSAEGNLHLSSLPNEEEQQ